MSAALGSKTITLMADTPLIYGSYSSRMFPIIPDGENTVTHYTLGKDKNFNEQGKWKKSKARELLPMNNLPMPKML